MKRGLVPFDTMTPWGEGRARGEGGIPLFCIILVGIIQSCSALYTIDGPRVKVSTNPITVVNSGIALLVCEAEGNPTPILYWRKTKGGRIEPRRYRYHITDVPGRSVLSIDPARNRKDGDVFTCVAKNRQRAEAGVTLSVLSGPPDRDSFPGFSTSPTDTEGWVGESVTLECEATGDPVPQVTWIKDHLPLNSSDSRITVTESGSLHIRRLSVWDQGRYQCLASNSVGFRASSSARLSVLVLENSDINLRIHPEHQSVATNKRADIFCINGGTQPSFFRWVSSDGAEINRRSNRYRIIDSPFMSVLSIDPTRPRRDHMNVTCIAEGGSRSVQVTSQLVVTGTRLPRGYPEFERGLFYHFVVEEGSTAEIRCDATGDPEPSIDWLRNDMLLDVDNTRYSIFQSGVLKITDAKPEDAGRYECMARNRVGVSFSPTTLIFVRRVDHQQVTNEPPQPKLTIIGDRFPTMGKRFELLCKFDTTAEDAIPVDWFKDGELVTATARYSFSNSLRPAESVQTSTLIIKEPQLADAGTYVCRTPLNTLNSVEVYIVTDSSTDLTINGSARFEGEDMKITCNVTGEPERDWDIVWFKDGEQVDISLPRIAVSRFEDLFEKKMSSTLKIRKSRISDSGNYTCRTNKNHSKTVHIQVREAESSQRDLMLPQNKKVFEGGSVIFFCEALDTATSITWKHSSGRMPVNSSVYDRFGTKSALKVPAVSMADKGVVTCIVDEPGWRRVVSADLQVYEASYWREQLRGKGYPVIELESEREVVERGTSVQLRCSSYGQPKPSIVWLKDHFPVDTTSKRFSLLSSGTLEIRNVTERDEGVYECEAENEVGVAYSAPAVLETVDTSSLSPGVTITGNLRPVYGSNATITCKAIGAVGPPAGIEWFKDGYRIRGNSKKYSETIDRKIKYFKSILTIANIQVTDNGVYVCRSTDMHITSARLIAHEALLTEKDRTRPPVIPQNLTVRSVSETQVVLTWDLPLTSLINKKIIMYQITYHQLDDPISDEVLNVTTNDTHVEISDLEMNTDYQSKIRAYTSKGPGPWSNRLYFRTSGQIPPAPKNVKLRYTSRSSVEVTWDEPGFPVAGYEIYYNMFPSPEMEDWSTLEIGPITVAEITGLDLHKIWVRVQAKSVDGYYGTLSEMVNIELNQEYEPDEGTKAVNTSSLSPGVTITGNFIPEYGSNAMITCEAIGAEHVPMDIDWFHHGKRINANSKKYLVTKLIRRKIKSLKSMLTIANIQVTDSGVYVCRSTDKQITSARLTVLKELKAPIGLNITETAENGSLSLQLKWVDPNTRSSDLQEGVYRQYAVLMWDGKEQETTRVQEPEMLMSEFDRNVTYNFSVRVEEGNDVSAWSNTSFQSALESVGPVGPVLEVRVRAISKSMVVVWWKEPKVVMEPIQGFRLFYTDHPGTPLHMWTVQEGIQDNLAVLSSLKPDTVYTFGVQAYTEHGQGPMSDLVQAPSDGGKQNVESQVPSIPTDLLLRVYRGIKPSMMVTWNSPNSTGSVIQTYNIEWDAYMQPSTTASLPSNKTRYLITGLEYNTTYTVSVSASNSVGKGDAVTESITTPPEVEAKTVNESDSSNGSIEAPQGAPEDLRVRPVSATAMLVSWNYLENEYVIIQGYKILFTSQPELPFFVWNVKDVGLKNAIVVDGLNPRTTYYFVVQAYTLLEEGPFSSAVQVLGSPQVIFEPEVQHVQEGGVASFFCKSSDGYTLKFEWMRNSQVVSVRSPIYEIVTKHWFSVLRVLSADPGRDFGAFTCVASNKNGTTNATGTLKVYEVSEVPTGYPQITVQPRVKAVVRGGTVTMSCEAKGDPQPTIKWLKDSFPVHVESARITSLQSGILVITEARESDVGQYECVAENQVGVEYSKGANLYVRAQRVPPRFTIAPSNRRVKPGADVNLTCAAFGTPMPFVKWFEGKRQLTDESSVPIGQNVLQLKNVRLSKNYTCMATTNQHKIEMTVEVVVGETPTITEGPRDRLTVAGEPLSFFCHGTGYPLPSFIWMKNFRVIIPRWSKYAIITRFNVSTLRIKEVTSADSGLYSCRVSNKHGTARARASLEVHEEFPSGYPQLVRLPSSRAVETDKRALLQCKAMGDPQPSIHWLKDYFPVNINDSNIKLLDSGNLEILYTRTSDDGKYECVAENIKGSTYSQAATLLVRVRRVPPRFTIHPVDSVVTPGSNVNLTCAAEGSPMPSVKWLKGTEELTDEASGPIGRNDLLLKDVRETKLYTCIATSSLGQEETIAQVTVAEQPEITRPPKNQLSVNKETVSFICRASGLPAPRFEWKRGSDGLYQYTLHHEINNRGDTSVLRIHRVKSSRDNGTYTCIARNQYGEARVSASLTVHNEKPNGYPRIVLNPSLKAVESGRAALMQCEAGGNPRPTIRWLKDYFPVNMSDPRIQMLQSGYLEIRSSQPSDAGKYECVAENIKGSAYSWDAALHVRVRRVPPKFRVVPTDMFVKPGSDVNLTCVAVGSPMPFVKWNEGSRQLTDESSVPIGRNELLLKNVNESKTYTCIASSVLGREETEAHVVVEEPVPPGFPPREVQARAASSSTIVVGWEKPENLVDSSFQGYRVYYTRRPGEALKNWNMKDVDRDSRVTSISGLNSNKSYTITVTARSRYGEGPTSLPVQVVTVTGYSSHSQRPSPPQGLQAQPLSANEILVTWESPLLGSILGYELYVRNANTNDTTRISISPSVESYTITGLTPDTKYHIKVSATSRRGKGPTSPAVAVTTHWLVPGAPTITYVEEYSTEIYLRWKPPIKGNEAIIGYKIWYQVVNMKYSYSYYVFTVKKPEAVIGGRQPDTRYNVKVAAQTHKGNGNKTREWTYKTKPAAAPDAPQNLAATMLATRGVRVHWDPPRSIPKQDVLRYKLVFYPRGEESNASSLQTNTTVIDVGPFPRDVIYLFKVRAYTANGAGPYAQMIFKTF